MGLRWWRPHQALSRAFEPLADAGWPPPLASPVSFRRATQTYKAVRRAIQHSQESLRGLAKRHGVNPKTVAKWKARSSVSDLPTGPKQPRSTVLSAEEEAVAVAFRRHTLLPLDDCLYALQPTVPHLTRSSLHRCLQRHGISRLPQVEGEASAKRKFKAYPADKAQASMDHKQVERMNRTIKDATVKRYFYETHDQLRAHLQNFADAYNFARRLKTLRGLTPYEFICKAWTSEPH